MGTELAVAGGRPVRETLLPYSRPCLDDADVDAVVEVLRSDWLTTGPVVQELERVFAETTGVREAVAVSSGTAALHAAMHAVGVGSGDEVIVPAMTFAATANCVVHCGGTPVFADVDAPTLLLDPAGVEARITPRTKAIVAVDYAGQPCDYDALREIADRHGAVLVADACHSLGGSFGGRPVGSLAALSAFSFHAVKQVATGEGGMIATDDPEAAQRMRMFRNHGITRDHREREGWFYELAELGYNYRLSDLQCALGISQLRKLPARIERRREIAGAYRTALAGIGSVEPLEDRGGRSHAHHLFVVQLDRERLRVGRAEVFAALRAEGVGVNVHYIPVHLHPFYRRRFGTAPGLCPVAEAAYERIITLPLFSGMSDADAEDVLSAVAKVVDAYGRPGDVAPKVR